MPHEPLPRRPGGLLKGTLAVAALSALLLACGGSSDDSRPLAATWEGTVSGTNCFGGFPESSAVKYAVVIDDMAEGGTVLVRDAAGIEWTGTMTSATSFKVINPLQDPRMSIVANDVAFSGANVIATTSCVSFRCCTALSGHLQG